MNRLQEIEQRLNAIKTEMEAENADLLALTKEANELIAERNQLHSHEEARKSLLALIANGEIGQSKGSIQNDRTGQEERANAFVQTNRMSITAEETRSVLVSSGTLATLTKVSGINDLPDTVSSIVDMVYVEDCTGMSADKVAYQVSDSIATAGTEGSVASTSEPTFAYVTIEPKLYNLTSYVSNQIRNQTSLNYADKVTASAYKALRRKAAEEITVAVQKSTIADEITSITSIDEKTLRKIVLNYGSDDTVEGNAVLFLNKADLIAFGDVRGTDKKAVYEITPDGSNPNTGVIKDGGLSVRYCINNKCTALTGASNASTTATLPTMFYGQPQNIKLDLFGNYSVRTSEDYKFGEGLLSVLGEVSFGADVVIKGGILKVSLPTKSS